MLDVKQLQKKIKVTIQGKQDLILYGNKSSGKSTLCKKILNETIGKDYYIYIKCLFISSRESLLYLFGDELLRLISNMNSAFMMQKKEMEKYTKFINVDYNQSIGTWLNSVNKFLALFPEEFKKMKRIYIFMDNIQQITLSEVTIKQFYYALKYQLKYLKVSFFFCGLCHRSVIFNITEPFKQIVQYFMPRPNIEQVVKCTINQSKLYSTAKQSKIFEKLTNHLYKTICSSFQTLQYQTQYAYLMSQSFIKQVEEYVGTSSEKAKIWIEKNDDYEKQLLRKLNSQGPVTLERSNQENIKKNTGSKQIEEGQATFYMQNYPSLIMTAIGLANGFAESQDIKRFVDLRKTKSKKQKKLTAKMNADTVFRQDLKKYRHNKDRIIAISDTLEQQSKGSRLKEKQIEHHSLDYYGCFQYLRNEGCINYYGRSTSKFGGTVVGQHMKQSQVRDFVNNKLYLDYKTFTGKD